MTHSLNRKAGLSILEILVGIAIVSFVFIPAIQVIYSIQPRYIQNIVNGESPDTLASTSGNIFSIKAHDGGDLRTIYRRGGIWNAYSTSHEIFTRQSCLDFHQSTSTSTTPQVYLYTHAELGLSTSTKLTGVSIVGNNVFLSTDSASTTEPDIYMYSTNANLYASHVSPAFEGNNPKPVLTALKSKDTGPGVSSTQTRGTYIVTANTGVKSQIDILKVFNASGIGANSTTSATSTNSMSEWTQRSLVIPGSNSSTTPLTKTILYADDQIIVGTEKSVLPEIMMFDSKTGQVRASIETGYGINDMVIKDGLLIVAGPRDPEIEVFDIQDPAHLQNPQKVGQFDLPGGSGNAKTLTVFGDSLYVGRTKGGDEFVVLRMDEDNGVSSYAASTASSSTRTLEFTQIFKKKIQWSIDALLKYDVYTILLTADEYSEFQLYKDEGINPTLSVSLDLPSRVSSAMCFKNSIWITFRDVDSQAQPYVLGVVVL
ncbi:MAG: hypothetical protein KBC87_02285 [Candidatus Pacebacteria bacterium]|nr:hypothetical protein [Candidatus Paceibacterota bacterium]